MSILENCMIHLPFYNLTDREYNAMLGICSSETQSKIDFEIDLFSNLPNPDKSDLSDPDHMLKVLTSNYHFLQQINRIHKTMKSDPFSLYHFNTRSLKKNLIYLQNFFILYIPNQRL